jgi:hypothetical protein
VVTQIIETGACDLQGLRPAELGDPFENGHRDEERLSGVYPVAPGFWPGVTIHQVEVLESRAWPLTAVEGAKVLGDTSTQRADTPGPLPRHNGFAKRTEPVGIGSVNRTIPVA